MATYSQVLRTGIVRNLHVHCSICEETLTLEGDSASNEHNIEVSDHKNPVLTALGIEEGYTMMLGNIVNQYRIELKNL